MYGMLVIGAPGSGKSTFCNGIEQLLQQLKRPTVMVNLDPANDVLPYKCDVDIKELITVDDVMDRLKLGPNGALRYCMHTLIANVEWLRLKLSKVDGYMVVDLPGQLELYNSDDSMKKLFQSMEKWGHHLVALHLTDSLYCVDAGKFIGVILAALSVMINLEVPQLNLLSKMDLLNENHLPYNIDFFKHIPDAQRLAHLLNDNEVLAQYKGMNESLCSVIGDYDLVNFIGLDVSKKDSMVNVLKLADRANGFTLVEKGDLRGVMTSFS